MSYYMSRGPSGRVVVELEPDLKRELYVELSREGKTLKNWLTTQAHRYIRERQQPSLFPGNDEDRGESRHEATATKEAS
jgi:hypothetical protein